MARHRDDPWLPSRPRPLGALARGARRHPCARAWAPMPARCSASSQRPHPRTAHAWTLRLERTPAGGGHCGGHRAVRACGRLGAGAPSAPPPSGHGHAVGGRRVAVSDSRWRAGQLERLQPGGDAADLAEAGGAAPEHGGGAGLLGSDGAARGRVRFHPRGRDHPGRSPSRQCGSSCCGSGAGRTACPAMRPPG